MLIAQQIIDDTLSIYSDLYKNDYGSRPRGCYTLEGFQRAVEWIEGRPNQPWGYGDAPTAADEAYYANLGHLEHLERECEMAAYYGPEPWGSEDAEPLPYEEFDVIA